MSKQPLVVVADDDAHNRALAQAALEGEGYQVVLTEDGEQALAAVQQLRPDCVLLDVRMPKMDGLTACRKLRELPEGRELPIVVLTALRDIETFDEALAAGADDFLTKPMRVSELTVRIAALHKLRQLDAALREQVDEVRHQRDELFRIQLQKERLSSFVVHDLKGPINSIGLLARSVLSEQNLSDRSQRSMQAIQSECSRLLRMVHNLLDLSRDDGGQLQPRRERVCGEALLRDACAAVQISADMKQVLLKQEAAGLGELTIDPQLIGRVLENLLENAVRHTPSGGTVVLRGRRLPSGEVELEVHDSGPGVPPELRERIFERFVQLEPSARSSRSGRGLGLAFAKMAVEAHGGDLSVRDVPQGASFVARIP